MVETHSTKAVAVGKSNNAGVWGPAGGHATAILQLFSPKYTFLGIFWSKILLKTAFLNG